MLALLVAAAGCTRTAQSQSGGPGGAGRRGGPPAVDVVRAQQGTLRPELEYTGTTRATREVTVRARTEGRLLRLNVDVGDPVRRGQEVGRLDDELLRTALRQAEAELSSRQAEAASARTQVGDARTRVEQARLDLQLRKANFQRTYQLWGQGYESRQNAEQGHTAVGIARQVLRSAEQQVRTLQEAVVAANARVKAQRAVVAQERERLTYSVLISPIDGFVTSRVAEAGNLILTGGEVVRVGDFRPVQVDVEVSELELENVAIGRPARVRLDAFPQAEFVGRVDRISPQADPVSRLVPVAVTIPNENRRIGAGLLARVRFGSIAPERVLIPEAALEVRQASAGGRGSGSAEGTGSAGRPGPAAGGPETGTGGQGGEPVPATIFVLYGPDGRMATGTTTAGDKPDRGSTADGPAPDAGAPGANAPPFTVRARIVRVGARADGQAEVLSGLAAGERVVTRSGGPLQDGMEVRPSILSEEALGPAPAREAESPRGEGAAIVPQGLSRGTGATSSGDAGQARGSGVGRGVSAGGSGGAMGGFGRGTGGRLSSPGSMSGDFGSGVSSGTGADSTGSGLGTSSGGFSITPPSGAPGGGARLGGGRSGVSGSSGFGAGAGGSFGSGSGFGGGAGFGGAGSASGFGGAGSRGTGLGPGGRAAPGFGTSGTGVGTGSPGFSGGSR